MRTTTLGTARRGRIAGLASAVAGIGLLVTACAGPAGAAGSSAPATTAGSSAPATASGSSAPATTSGSQQITVETHTGPMGSYLTDGNGKTLYLFAHDKGKTSTCNGSCAHFWPPFTTTASPKGAGTVQSGDLATSKRSDGSTQVTYHGHPLYYFFQDQAAGDTKGQGLNQDGGLWWLVSPTGRALTKTGTTTHSSSPASGGGAAGGWS
jgi:predicted lipoprotein with Yx(FWY)xxD motif